MGDSNDSHGSSSSNQGATNSPAPSPTDLGVGTGGYISPLRESVRSEAPPEWDNLGDWGGRGKAGDFGAGE
jgi:hypothetical protein